MQQRIVERYFVAAHALCGSEPFRVKERLCLGKIDLVDVRNTEIYLEMSGGCQGCALSRMTLRQGVEKMLRQSVPEITAVHDVTDHAGGQNPYFNGEV